MRKLSRVKQLEKDLADAKAEVVAQTYQADKCAMESLVRGQQIESLGKTVEYLRSELTESRRQIESHNTFLKEVLVSAATKTNNN